MTAQWPLVEAALGIAGWTAVRATLLLAGAALLALALRRSSAEARHALWTVTLGGLLALPVLSVALPPVPVDVPGAEVVTRILGGSAPGLERPGQAATDEERVADGTSVVLESAAAPGNAAGADGGTAGPWTVPPSGAVAAREALASFPAAPDAGVRGGIIPPGGAVRLGLLFLWVGGALAVSVPLALGMARAHRMCLRSLPLGGAGWPAAPWMAALERAARKVGLRRRVALRVSPRARTALAGGVRRPVVLLPDDAVRWSDERRDLVLTHELVHLRRLDPVRQLCGRLVLAIYWFHPLAWWAVRAAAIAREDACDEAVLRLGHRPSTYARHLVELAAAPSRPLPALSAMDSPRLEKRIRTILNAPHRSDGPRRRRWAIDGSTACAAAWALAAALVVPVDRAVAAGSVEAAVGEAAVGGVAVQGVALDEVADGGVAVEEVRQAAPERSGETAAVPLPAPEASETAPFGPLPEAAPPVTTDPDPRCAPLRVGPGRDVAAGRRAAEAEPVLSAVLEQPDGAWLCMQHRGAARFGPDGRLLPALPEGAWLVVSGTDDHRQRRVEMEGRDGEVVIYWTVDGEERPCGEEARTWLVEALQGLDRHGAVMPVRPLQRVEPLPDTVPTPERVRLRETAAQVEEAVGRLRVEMRELRPDTNLDVARLRYEVLAVEARLRTMQQEQMVALERLREQARGPNLSAEELEAALARVQEAVGRAQEAHRETLRRLGEQLQRRGVEGGAGSPPIVVDGVVLGRDGLSAIDPDRIEAVEVIRGAEAAALYGSRARDGVIIITTIRR
jgi:TonB-dependent SusC/RagA subfamily outer membrane receptor